MFILMFRLPSVPYHLRVGYIRVAVQPMSLIPCDVSDIRDEVTTRQPAIDCVCALRVGGARRQGLFGHPALR
jgi:hypothetical protein